MSTVQNLTVGKNELWTAYKDAGPLKHYQILLELKEAGLHRHWLVVASKEGYDLPNAKGKLIQIFLKHMPETAHLFGVTL
ncbi:hypothetical protein GO755_33660 [Spirosoma sp. HMF4905]|uniref:Uncharacterized protein n=1 Tax=Spirosoma arboris TaxID=2682092 RepID=A0A7K1SMJ5_9BACT|nr:hypothetical protein [Spirosoma arboris]MVM35022.1 hypothetical protein [Spirosoma arboris]